MSAPATLTTADFDEQDQAAVNEAFRAGSSSRAIAALILMLSYQYYWTGRRWLRFPRKQAS